MSENKSKVLAKKLMKELSDTRRALELSEQINDIFTKIDKISEEVIDVSNQLADEVLDKDDNPRLENFQHLRVELINKRQKMVKRLQMLREVQTNGCLLNVSRMPYKRTTDKTFVINGKEVFVEGVNYDVLSIDDETEVEDSDDETEVEYSDDNDTEDSDQTSNYSGGGLAVNRKRKPSPRKRIIPERFVSFPKKSRRSNGQLAIICALTSILLFAIMSLLIL